MNITVFKFHSVPFFLLTSESQTAEYNKGSNPSVRKERIESPLLTPDFHSWEEREVCQRGSIVSALTAGWYKRSLLQYCSFGRMCCVCEINGNTQKTLHNTPPSLSPSQTLGLLWINCLAEVNGNMRGGTTVRRSSQLPSATSAYPHPQVCYISTALITPRDLPRSTKKKPSAIWLPQFNQDVSHGCFPKKMHQISFSYGNIVKAG